MLGLCAYQTSTRLWDWRSDEALWRAAVAVSPEAPRPALNLAAALVHRSARDEAAFWAARAVELARARGDDRVEHRATATLTWIDLMRASPDCASSRC